MPARVDRLEAEVARRTPGASRSRAPGATTRAPMPSGPSSHFWAATAYSVRARGRRSRTGSRRRSARRRRRRGRPAAWAISAMAGDRQHRAGRSTARARATTSRVRGVDRGRRTPRASVASSPPSPTSTKSISTPRGRAARRAGRARPACSSVVVDGAVAGSPVDGHDDRRSCRRSSSGSARSRPTSVPSTAATAARASAIRWRTLEPVVGVGPAGRQLAGRRSRPSPPRSRPGSGPTEPVLR